MTSTPYQMLMMKIRHIYRWDNKTETTLYLAAYAILWAFNYLAGAVVSSAVHRPRQQSLIFPDPCFDRTGLQTSPLSADA